MAPGHAPYVEYLGRSLLALGRHEAAIVQFQALGRRAGLEKQGLLLEAQALAASGDVLAARAVVERAISARHADVSTYTLCADLSLQLRDAAGAVRCADIALAADAGIPTRAPCAAKRWSASAPPTRASPSSMPPTPPRRTTPTCGGAAAACCSA